MVTIYLLTVDFFILNINSTSLTKCGALSLKVFQTSLYLYKKDSNG